MRERRHSKSGLFLIELMISITVFAMTSAIFLQVFAKSHVVSREAEELFQAQNLASSAAEILEGSRDFSGDLPRYFPGVAVTENRAVLGYNENWQPTEEKAKYVLLLDWTKEEGMWVMNIQVTGEGGEKIYSLQLHKYQPEEGDFA